MMNNFDNIIDRTNTNSEKWDLRKKVFGKSVLPMWVADTDFPIPNFLVNTLKNRISSSPLGYTFIPDNFFDSINKWHKEVNNSDISYLPKEPNATVMSSMNILIRLLTKKNDKVLIFNPIYFPFFKTVEKTGRIPLFFDLTYNFNSVFEIDFNALKKFVDKEQPKLILFCNPHNPGGKVWSREDLSKLVSISNDANIPIISDEIHSDIILKGKFTSLTNYFNSNNNYAVLDGPTKTFNIAGLKTSFVIFSNQKLKDNFITQRDSFSYPKMNTLAIESAMDVYKNGHEYLHELLKYLQNNLDYLTTNLDPKYKILPAQATYLVFIKIPAGIDDEKFYKETIENGIGIQLGNGFGSNGKHFFRLNIGTQLKNINTAVTALNNIVSK